MLFKQIAKVIVPNIHLLDYLAPDETLLEKGDFVEVLVKSKIVVGLVHSIEIRHENEISVRVKTIIANLNFNINSTNIKFIEWVASYYLVTIGSVYKMLLPNAIANSLLTSNQNKSLKQKKFDTPAHLIEQIELNPEQISAVEEILTNFSKGNLKILLDGITGSGKTEVYIAIIKKIILDEQSAQILVLIPEIALTSQILDIFKKRFNQQIFLWHSELTLKNKKAVYIKILSGEPIIIIGTRSAVFLPFKNLKLIVVDEEHDSSYKQEDNVCYQARDMSLVKASLTNIPIILASASPSLESLHNITQGKLSSIKLNNRFNNVNLAEVKIIDMKKSKNKFFSNEILFELKTAIKNNQQILVFLNRKGYAPVTLCSNCGIIQQCESCSSSLVFYHKKNILKCHQCGFSIKYINYCKSCDTKDNLISVGIGVEKVKSYLDEIFPEVKKIVLTQETFTSFNKTSEILNEIKKNNYQIIIGTQIIAKGHHFPSLTMVCILDGDYGLMNGDPRAAEKTFQLITQVGGRAGRIENDSKIFIQTFNPANLIMQSLAKHDRESFIKEELKFRKISMMPPFYRLASIIISAKTIEIMEIFLKELFKIEINFTDVKILGPTPALIFKINNNYRYRILFKAKNYSNISRVISNLVSEMKIPNSIKIKIDIDPYNFV